MQRLTMQRIEQLTNQKKQYCHHITLGSARFFDRNTTIAWIVLSWGPLCAAPSGGPCRSIFVAVPTLALVSISGGGAFSMWKS
jgi:hypothetical protein